MTHPGQAEFIWTEENVQRLIAQSRLYVRNVRWRHQGRTVQGVDCIGLFYLAAKEIGCILTMPTNYTLDPSHANLRLCMESLCEEIKYDQILPGDFALVRYVAKPTHLVMITDRGILHSSAESRGVVEHSIDEEHRRSIASCWSVKGRKRGG